MRTGWSLRWLVFLAAVAPLATAQVGNGTITGTVTDPAGAVVAAAQVTARNAETGVVYSAATTSAGIYTITDLPVGRYTVQATVQGFKSYSHSNITVQAQGIVREDIPLQLGATNESVTVTGEASLLKTESGELATNVTIQQMDELPLLGVGTVNAGTSGYRNPYNTLLTLPGVSTYASSGQFAINGLGGTSNGSMTETMRIEGQDSTSRIFGTYDYTQMAQPGADSIQEVAYQTSNYAPEFGQAGSVVINMTMKSGTNQYHGSGFDYFVNEDLNAGDPFSINTDGVGKVRPINRRNDFGGTLGGPIDIPKLYNGHNKSFFFFSYEEYLEHASYNFTDTVPTTAYRNGDFSAISANGTCSLCAGLGVQTAPLGSPTVQLDPAGNPLYANEIFDPLSRSTVNGVGTASPFMNNQIPATRIDPISAKFQALFPQPTDANLLSGNYAGIIGGNRYSAIPAVKIDHNVDAQDKLSFYYSENNTQSQISSPLGNADGLPAEIGGYRGTFIPTYTERLNYDRTLTPTLLLHLGAGYMHTSFSDRAPFLGFDPSAFNLSGFLINRQFPSITGLCSTSPFIIGCTNATGGMQNVGTSGQIQTLDYEEKPSFVGSLTWVHGKHTYKAGAEVYLEQDLTGNFAGVTMAVGANAGSPTYCVATSTCEPFIPTNSFNNYTEGFGYASFLLGDYTSSTQTPQENYREGQQVWGLYAQDSWKATRKLTVDYGLRWDYDTPEMEQYGRLGQLAENIPNANAGGRLGATQYAQTCNCNFYSSAYPYAFGPRIGVAYQLTPKTVLRGGWGFVYQFVGYPAGATVGTAGVNSPNNVVNAYVSDSAPGFIATPTWPVVNNASIYPIPGDLLGAAGNTPYVPDPQQNRPPRVNQYSFSIQREITNNFILEAAYVGNHAVWISGPYGFLSQTSAQEYALYGLFPYPGTGPCASNSYTVCSSTSYNNDADRALLTQPLSSPAVIQTLASRGIKNILPYSGFPTTTSLQGALYPYPQFGALEPAESPTGDSMYDSLQMKATKRFSHGLQAGGTFTWAKGYASPSSGLGFGAPPNQVQDFFNHTSEQWVLQQLPPLDLNFNFIYTTPNTHYFPKILDVITRDWQIGGFANYQSGEFLSPPLSTTYPEFLPSEDVPVPGQPFYTSGVNPNNLGSYNPYYTQVLNPKAWTPCQLNSVCAAPGTLYSNFRAPRTPTENANLGRHFRIKERMDFYIRAEFVNIFNRTLMPAPLTNGLGVNPGIPAQKNGQGIYVNGFGVINAYLAPGTYYAAPTQATSAILAPRTGTLVARFSF